MMTIRLKAIIAMATTSIAGKRFIDNAIALPNQFSLRSIACIIASIISLKELITSWTTLGRFRARRPLSLGASPLLRGECRIIVGSRHGVVCPVHLLAAAGRFGESIDSARTVGTVHTSTI